MKYDINQFFGEITPEVFLRDYWQKKPLFVKGAIPNASKLASAENLVELAMSENFETRIVREKGGKTPWESCAGPFTLDELSISEKDKWTLIVHNLELYFEEFREIKKMINFIPSWQFDDIMSTYSINGASVGAHIDNYNVFIFQGSGKRKWSVSEKPDDTYIDGLDIKLLSNFKEEYSYILEEGDMIYIPPGVAHHGMTIEDSISYSIGFKAFDYCNMAMSFLGEFLHTYDSSKSLQEKKQSIQKNVNELLPSDLDNVMDFFLSEVVNRKNIEDWFGRYISAPRIPILAVEEFEESEIEERLLAGDTLNRDEFLRFNFITEGNLIKLFVNEKSYMLEKSEYLVLENVFDNSRDTKIRLSSPIAPKVLVVLRDLIEQGALFFSDAMD